MNLLRCIRGSALAGLILLCWSPRGSAQEPGPSDPHQLRNISARARVETGDRVLIGGFIVRGEGAKTVLIRGLGPSLRVGGAPIVGRLTDPTLDLHSQDTGQLIGSNDNWGDTQRTEIAATGIAPTEEAEAAILRTLSPGGYTAVMRGRNAESGTGLVEIYDVTNTLDPKLVNLSARAFVGTGDSVLIGGIIVGRGGAEGLIRAVVRALGPSLTEQGVPGPLQDPILELFNANGMLVMANDNAADDNLIELQETGLIPPHASESAMVVEVPQGNYTAVVRGKNGGTGIGMVEVYEAPRTRPL